MSPTATDTNVRAPREQPSNSAATRHSELHHDYRSVADGDLVRPWSLKEYFGSLNTVMRLPPKVRQRVEKAAKSTPGGVQVLALLDRVRIPTGFLVGAFLLAVAVMVIRPLVLDASGAGVDATPVYGNWEAGKGKYEGRMFEINAQTIAFRTSAKEANYTRHSIEKVRGRQVGDSTLYTVFYKEDGKSAEFAFWFYGGGSPMIRFKNQHGIVWRKAR
jgi:hypothetical protein